MFLREDVKWHMNKFASHRLFVLAVGIWGSTPHPIHPPLDRAKWQTTSVSFAHKTGQILS